MELNSVLLLLSVPQPENGSEEQQQQEFLSMDLYMEYPEPGTR